MTGEYSILVSASHRPSLDLASSQSTCADATYSYEVQVSSYSSVRDFPRHETAGRTCHTQILRRPLSSDTASFSIGRRVVCYAEDVMDLV